MSESPAQRPPIEPTESRCQPLELPEVPTLPTLEPCPQPCCCPPGPGGDGFACLTDLIRDQSSLAEQATAAKEFGEALRALQDKAITARTQYTRAKFEALTRAWTDQDAQIATLAQQIGCAVKCWKCLLECRLCTLLYDIRVLERRLHGTGTYHETVDTLEEMAQWHGRNRAERQAVLDRIAALLAAWQDPVKNIEDALERDRALIDAIKPMIAADPAGAVYALFVKLIPTHVAIQPRGPDGKGRTSIDPDFIHICDCDTPDVDDCCGPDTGERSVRHRLLPPLPYLVDPDAFFDVLCCLIKERYLKANEALSRARADHEQAKQEVERVQALVKAKTDALEADFMAELSPLDCDRFWKKRSDDDDCRQRPDDGPCAPEGDPQKPATPTPDIPQQQPSGA